MPIPTAAPDAFKLDAMTPEPEDLDTVAPSSVAPSPPKPHSLVLQPQDSAILGPGDALEEELRSKLSELVSRANSKDSSSSDDDECARQPVDRQTDKESDRQREKVRSKDTAPCSRLRDRASSKDTEGASETAERMNGQEIKRSARLVKSASVREEGRFWEGMVVDQEPKRGDKRETNRQSKRQHKREVGREVERRGARRSASCASSPALSPSSQEGVLSDNQVRVAFDLILHILSLLCPARGAFPVCLSAFKCFIFISIPSSSSPCTSIYVCVCVCVNYLSILPFIMCFLCFGLSVHCFVCVLCMSGGTK